MREPQIGAQLRHLELVVRLTCAAARNCSAPRKTSGNSLAALPARTSAALYLNELLRDWGSEIACSSILAASPGLPISNACRAHCFNACIALSGSSATRQCRIPPQRRRRPAPIRLQRRRRPQPTARRAGWGSLRQDHVRGSRDDRLATRVPHSSARPATPPLVLPHLQRPHQPRQRAVLPQLRARNAHCMSRQRVDGAARTSRRSYPAPRTRPVRERVQRERDPKSRLPAEMSPIRDLSQ